MVKSRKCPSPFFSSRKLEKDALKIAIGFLNPCSYIELPLAQKLAFNGENFGQFTANSQYLSLLVTIKILQLTLVITNTTPRKNRRRVRLLHSSFQARKKNTKLSSTIFPHMPQGVDIKLKCSYVIIKKQ